MALQVHPWKKMNCQAITKRSITVAKNIPMSWRFCLYINVYVWGNKSHDEVFITIYALTHYFIIFYIIPFMLLLFPSTTCQSALIECFLQLLKCLSWLLGSVAVMSWSSGYRNKKMSCTVNTLWLMRLTDWSTGHSYVQSFRQHLIINRVT